MNFLTLANLRGVYTSEQISIPLIADGVISKISWKSDAPNGSSIIVQTRYSNNGRDWSDWMNCINEAKIPDLDIDTFISNPKLMFRVIITKTSYDPLPKFREISFQFEPVLVFDNKGDTTCTPEIWIEKVGTGSFSLNNISNNNEKFEFDYIGNGEKIYVNSENEYIETSAALIERYSNFNDGYLKLPIGRNIFKVKGHAKIQFRSQFKLI